MSHKKTLKTVSDWLEEFAKYPPDTEVILLVVSKGILCDSIKVNGPVKRQFCGECDVVFLEITDGG